MVKSKSVIPDELLQPADTEAEGELMPGEETIPEPAEIIKTEPEPEPVTRYMAKGDFYKTGGR